MTVARIPTPLMSATDAISYAIEACTRRSLPPGKVLSEESLAMLSPEALRYFARVGWMHETNHKLTDDRRGPTEEPNESVVLGSSARAPRPGRHPIDGRNPFGIWKPLEGIRIQGADGLLKRLLDFDRADLDKLATDCAAQETGWGKRKRWAEAAKEAIGKNKRAKKVEELASTDVERLGQLAAEAWK